MQVCLHSLFFFVSAFFSVFIFLFDAEEESKAANAIAVTPEARMRATIVFFMAKKIVHNLNPFRPGFLLAAAIAKVCFILAAFVPGVFALSIQKRKRFR